MNGWLARFFGRVAGSLPCIGLVVVLGLSTPAHSDCRPSTTLPPQHIVGLQLVHADNPSGWKAVSELKPDWVRLEIHWNLIEATEGVLDWSLVDASLRQAAANPAKILLLINNMPDWAASSPDPAAAFRRLLSSFFIRYSGHLDNVKAYEIFNEPNNPGFGWLSTNRTPESNVAIEDGPSAQLFAKFLQVSNEVIRVHAPDALIVSGGLFSSPNAIGYLRRIRSYGVDKCVDIIGYHPYANEGTFVQTQRQLEGIAEKPVWFTEYGTVDNRARGGLLTSTFSIMPELNAVFWFIDRDFGIFSDTYGLVDYFGVPKSDYALFQSLQAVRR